MEKKLMYLLLDRFNIFHADLINAALHNEEISFEDFCKGVCEINKSEWQTDNDEFVPKEFQTLYMNNT